MKDCLCSYTNDGIVVSRRRLSQCDFPKIQTGAYGYQ